MGVTNANKTASLTQINCDGTFDVTLALTATPDITTNPTDIVLVLDRSGSMEGSALANLKLSAKKFIQIIDQATDGSGDGQIGSGSRIGIVSFAGTASQDTALITSVADLNAAVDALSAGGLTNHADAFSVATSLLSAPSSNAKVMVMFTDGNTTAGGNPSPVAAAARAQGIVIYVIGLIGSDGIDISALNNWATDPDTSHVAVTPDEADLETLFEDLAANISNPGATSIFIDETVEQDFRILSLQPPVKGSAMLTGERTLTWSIPELGVTSSEGASLTFTVKHVGTTGGTKKINQSVSYHDDQNNVVTFPEPSVDVDCTQIVVPEPCPQPVELTAEGCRDTLVADAGEISLQSLGRILELSVTIRNVCPRKRVGLAVLLSEQDESGIEHARGTKILTVPAHDSSGCRDVLVKGIRFVLPEDLNVSGCGFCKNRSFKARFLANLIDSDFVCPFSS